MENDNSLLYFMHNIDLDIANLIRHSSVKLKIAMTFYFQLNREKNTFFNSTGKNGFNQLLRSFVIISKQNRKHLKLKIV